MEMDRLQDQNLTTGSAHPGVTYWESTAQMSTAVKNTIMVLGVLTFVLQLCLVLFLMLKCWRLDGRVRRAKRPCDVDKHPTHQICTAPAPAKLTAVRIDEDGTDFLCPPSIPWDLVQSG